MTKAYSYVRFSTPEQMKGDSYRRQLEAAERYAAQHDLELDRGLSFRDAGVSAFRGTNSETGALAAFLDAARDGLVPVGSVLLVESLDRISRQSARKALRVLEDIADVGITVVTLCDGRVYDSETLDQDPLTLLTSILIFIRGNEESSIKSARLKAVYGQKRQRLWNEDSPSQPFTRRLPAWLFWNERRSRFEILEARAKVVRQIFDWADSGWGQHAIAGHLNEQNVPTFGKANRWHRSYIAKLLKNPAVIGTFIPHVREEVEGGRRRVPLEAKKDYWPKVIDREVYERVFAQATARGARGRNAGSQVKSIIAGLGRCARCGSSAVRVSKGKFVYVVCSAAHGRAGCTYDTIRYEDVEESFRTNLDVLEEAPRGDATKEIEEKLAEADFELSALSDEARDLTDELIRSKSVTVRDRLAEVERSFRDCQARVQRLQDQRERESSAYVLKRLSTLRMELSRPEFDVGQANRALKACVSKIVVDPLAGTMDVHWHGGDGSACSTIPVFSRHVFKHD